LTETTSPRRFVIGVVDNDVRVLESLEELLASGGHDVLLFSSATALLASGALARIDCLISDLYMPGLSGWELVAIARTQKPNVPIIVITAHDHEFTRRLLAETGIGYLFWKPFDGSALLRALAATIPRRESDDGPDVEPVGL
jgi:FixJ family two-component response regulator